MLYGHYLQAMSASFCNAVAPSSTCQGARPEAERKHYADGWLGFFFWWLSSPVSSHATISPLDLGSPRANTSRVKFRALVSSLTLVVASMGAVGARPQQPATPPELPQPTAQLTPAEMEIYQRAHTLVDWTTRQIRNCPFLRKLRPARSQDQLSMVLERVGQVVTLLLNDFPRIACDEELVSEVPSDARRRTLSSAKLRKFHYIAVPQSLGDFQGFEEYRTDFKGNRVDASSLSDFFVITSNFISTYLYLSPADQCGSHFRYFGVQSLRQRKCHVVGFAQDPERARRVGTFQVQDKRVGVLIQGLAWIDPETFQILQITTWGLAPRVDIGLNSIASTVDFYPVRLSGFERVLWLPREVTVASNYRGTWFSNTHHYSNFKLFRVESTIKTAE